MTAPQRTPVKSALVAVAVVFSLLYAWYFLTHRKVTDVSQLQAFFEMTLFGVAVVALFGSVWLAVQTETRARSERRLLLWAVGGGIFLIVVNISMMSVVHPSPDFEDQLLQLLLSGGFGMSGGLVMGVLEIRESQQERARAQSELEARRRKEERERLELLNQYLRHEILNKVQIIGMNADFLLRRSDGELPERHRLETIQRRSRDIGTFVKSIRSILQASDHRPSLEPVELAPLAEEEAGKVDRSFEGVTVTTDVPEGVAVVADPLLSMALSNLLENAAENGAESIRLDAVTADSAVTIRVSDDGPGIPESARQTLFDPPAGGDHGYGLFLTKNLIELYGGRLELTETGPDGTRFEIRLGRSDTETTPWETQSVKAA